MPGSQRKPVASSVAAFLAGFSVMGIEILASRLVAPALGASVLIWTNLIGVILLALASGAWFGGWIADRRQDRRLLGGLLFAAGLFTLPLVFTTEACLWLAGFLPETAVIPLVALFLLAPPAFLLGAVPPAAVRLTLREVGSAGNVAGKLSALGTLGSLVGTYLTGYILIARWPTDRILNFLALLLLAVGAWFFRPGRRGVVALYGLALSVYLPTQFFSKPMNGVTIPSRYSALRIVEGNLWGNPVRVMWMDNVAHAASPLDRPEQSAFPYYELFERFADLLVPEARRHLAVGGGGFHGPRLWLAHHPDGRATSIERDPAAIETSKTFFGLKDDPRLSIIEGDGRASLRALKEKYEVVLIDAYADHLTIPWHLITREAWEELDAHLSENALVVMNLIIHERQDHPGNRELIAGIVNAAGDGFRWAKIARINDHDAQEDLTNALLLMGKGSVREPSGEEIRAILEAADAYAEPMLYPIDRSAQPAFTDRYAPVEYVSLKLMD